MEKEISINPGISRGNSLYQERLVLEKCATIPRAVRQSKLEQAKAYNAMRENHILVKKNELEAKVLEEEAEKLSGAAKELKLFEAKEKRENYPIEYAELIRDAIVKYNFYGKFLEEHSDVGLEQFEAEEEMYFDCKRLLDKVDKLGEKLLFNEQNLKLPVVHHLAQHNLKIAEYSNRFADEMLPALSGSVSEMLKLQDSPCEKEKEKLD